MTSAVFSNAYGVEGIVSRAKSRRKNSEINIETKSIYEKTIHLNHYSHLCVCNCEKCDLLRRIDHAKIVNIVE